MKILHTVQSLDPAWGGIARVLPALAAELVAGGDSCRIATLAGGRFGQPPPGMAGVDVLTFAPSGSRLGSSAEFNRTIDTLVREADVVHMHGLWTGQNWSTGKAARRAGKPYVMTPHSMMMPWAWQRSRWKKLPAGWLFEHRNLRGAACLHALAEGEAASMRSLGFNPSIVVIPNGLRLAEFENLPASDDFAARHRIPPDRKWLLFLGRIHPQKGIIQAMQGCFDAFPKAEGWHLIVAGPDEVGMRPRLEAAVQRKGMAERVTFTGLLPRNDVLAALGRAQLLLQPSMSEGLSMSILEALASGVPVIISHDCNMPEVEKSGAGICIESDRGAVSLALRKVVTMPPADFEKMRTAARTLARERYDWGKLVPVYHKMYADIGARRVN